MIEGIEGAADVYGKINLSNSGVPSGVDEVFGMMLIFMMS